MINSLRLRNFKAFKDSGEIPLPRLTCLVGRNSSGKSSLLHALLLLRQSNEERGMSSPLPQLLLNGASYEAGTFEDVVFDHRTALELGVTFNACHEPKEPGASKLPAGLVPLQTARALPRWIGIYRPFGLVNAARLGRRVSTDISYFFAHEKPFGPALSRLEVKVDEVGSALFKRASGSSREQHWRMYTSDLPPSSLSIVFPGGRLFPRIEPRTKVYDKVGPHLKKRINDFAYFALSGFAEVAFFLQDVRFLGPFRTPPRRRYVFTGFAAADAGPSGEQAVDLLIMEALLRPKERQFLRKSVSFWLRRLGLAQSIRVRDLARRSNLFELVLGGAGWAASANFADVGFGISQVLPVIVQGMLTPAGGTYVVQQPELHLHPDAQAGLADFFVYLAQRGIRCVVETHSEYFLLRLRREMAEGHKPRSIGLPAEESLSAKPLARSDVAVVLIEERKSDGNHTVRLEIGQSFQFENLPRDFMSQAIADRVGLLKALKKR